MLPGLDFFLVKKAPHGAPLRRRTLLALAWHLASKLQLRNIMFMFHILLVYVVCICFHCSF